MVIGVISDTHVPKRAKKLPHAVIETFSNVDHIIHAGDIMTIDVIHTLEKIAPVTAVAGNVDPLAVVKMLGQKKIINVGSIKIGIFHGHGIKGTTLDRAIKTFKNDTIDCIVFGHSHIPYCQMHNNILLFNPGSPTDKRRNKYYSIGLLDITHTITPKHILFSE
ncbi:metallophosphoesterase family protein [Petroclostridium sp. X23]|uniref:metallophosphoesterase family protein n=1 Tax=Petroclostridium sp. X23 TaxID=3045146 RepID=UPI0024ACC1F1|nr:metallophosphoesterase family protein [Petroclostridium sp. X23]WHH56994.1 metallophosphoesterase family protein [Petroclostridium sp. X23]